MARFKQKQFLDATARCLAAACVIALIFATFRLFNGADTPFLAFSVAGAAVVHFTNRPRTSEVVATALLAGVLAIAYARSGGVFGHYYAASAVTIAAFLGLGSTLVLGWNACRSTAALSRLLLAIFCPLLVIFTNVALAAIIPFQPRVFDLFLYRFDGLLGLQISFLAGKWFAASSLLQGLCFLVYAALPLAEVLVFLLFVRGNRMPANPLVVFIVAGVAGFAFYLVCPATGPVHVFGAKFPNSPPALLSFESLRLADVPRNAIPSLHSAWALLLWWNVRYCRRWVRHTAMVFLLLTLLATLGLGEHYLIDLVVALPFSAAVAAACARRFAIASGSAAMTLAWLLYLRLGLAASSPSPLQAWIAVLVTLAVSAMACAAEFKTRPTRTPQTPAPSGIPSVRIAE